MTPYKALYGKDPPSLNYHQVQKSKVANINEFLKERADLQVLLKQNLAKSQERMKYYADQRRSEREFNEGEEVFLKLQPYKQNSMRNCINEKFAAKFYGPYKIKKRVGKVAYQLELPFTARIHNTFHVSQLKKKLGDGKLPQTELPTSEDYLELKEPAAILDRRLVKKNGRPATLVLVLIAWSNSLPEDATWELYEDLIQKSPNFKP